jgi:hypothetical protein
MNKLTREIPISQKKKNPAMYLMLLLTGNIQQKYESDAGATE